MLTDQASDAQLSAIHAISAINNGFGGSGNLVCRHANTATTAAAAKLVSRRAMLWLKGKMKRNSAAGSSLRYAVLFNLLVSWPIPLICRSPAIVSINQKRSVRNCGWVRLWNFQVRAIDP